MSLAERRGLRLFTLCALFFAQGIPWGFFAITLPGYLASRGVLEGALGSAYAMSYWPYVFKWAGGPLIDAVSIPALGRRRPWIVLAQTMMAVSIAGLLAVRDIVASFELVLVLILVHTTFNALQNVATDALAIDLLDADERGRANGFMYGSKYAGGIVGGAGLSTMIESWGFEAAVITMAVLLGAIALVPIFVRERAGATPPRPEPREIARTLARIYRLRAPWLAALLMLVANIAGGVLGVVSPVLLRNQLSWDQTDYGWLVGGWGLLAGVAGSTLAGFLADKIGHRRLAIAASLAMAAGWTGFSLGEAWWTNHTFVYTFALLEPFTQAMLVVSLWSVCMSLSVKRTAATQFAAYTSLTNLSVIIGSRLLAGHVATWWSYPHIYLAAAAFQAAIVVIVPFIQVDEVRAKLAE